MTAKAKTYRAHAEDCRRGADKAKSPDDKAAWLDLAHSWLLLLRFQEYPAIALLPDEAPGWPEATDSDSTEQH